MYFLCFRSPRTTEPQSKQQLQFNNCIQPGADRLRSGRGLFCAHGYLCHLEFVVCGSATTKSSTLVENTGLAHCRQQGVPVLLFFAYFRLGLMITKLIGPLGMNSPRDILLHWELPTLFGSLRPSLPRNGGLQMVAFTAFIPRQAVRPIACPRSDNPRAHSLLQCGTRARPCVLLCTRGEGSDPAVAGGGAFELPHRSSPSPSTAGKTGDRRAACVDACLQFSGHLVVQSHECTFRHCLFPFSHSLRTRSRGQAKQKRPRFSRCAMRFCQLIVTEGLTKSVALARALT